MFLQLTRLSDNGIQTTGVLKLIDCTGTTLAQFDTLELAYKNNEKQVSCIPEGCYVVTPHISFRHGRCFEVHNVCHRSNILIHKGNFNSDTKGCILVGRGLRDISGDYQLDVLNSTIALASLRLLVKDTIALSITSKVGKYGHE